MPPIPLVAVGAAGVAIAKTGIIGSVGSVLGSVGGFIGGLFGGGNPNSTADNKKDFILGNGSATYGALYNHHGNKSGGVIHLTSDVSIANMWSDVTPKLSTEYWDDRISGVELAEGCTIELWSNPNYSGVKKTYTGPCNVWLYQEGFDDQMSSFKFKTNMKPAQNYPTMGGLDPRIIQNLSGGTGQMVGDSPNPAVDQIKIPIVEKNGYTSSPSPTKSALSSFFSKLNPMYLVGGVIALAIGLYFVFKK